MIRPYHSDLRKTSFRLHPGKLQTPVTCQKPKLGHSNVDQIWRQTIPEPIVMRVRSIIAEVTWVRWWVKHTVACILRKDERRAWPPRARTVYIISKTACVRCLHGANIASPAVWWFVNTHTTGNWSRDDLFSLHDRRLVKKSCILVFDGSL